MPYGHDMADAHELSRLAFREPPIRSSRLSVQFEQSSHVLSGQLAPLHAAWMTSLPIVEETAPDFEDVDIAGEDPDGPTWPLPSTKFLSVDGSQSVTLQEGRLDLEWNRTKEPYPGFDDLVGSLAERFEELLNAMDSAGIAIRPKSSSCLYRNEIEGISGSDLAVGVLTDWASASRLDLPAKGYVGVRIHACAEPENHHCSSYVMVDGDAGRTPQLTLSVKRRLTEGEQSPLGGLHEAHAELLQLFLKFTSDEQRDRWGRTG